MKRPHRGFVDDGEAQVVCNSELSRILASARASIEASVLVGGTLIGRNASALTDGMEHGVNVKFLFPSTTSPWLNSYLEAAGIVPADYVGRIRANADRIRNLGADARFHEGPIPTWFAIVDRGVVASKPVSARRPSSG